MNRANGTWFTTRWGITDPGVVLAGVDKPKGNAIRLLIGVAILGAVCCTRSSGQTSGSDEYYLR